MSDPERSEGPGWRQGARTGISTPDHRPGPSLRSGLLAAAIAVLFATNVYRAITQSVVHDEALAYQWFVAHPWSKMFSSFDVNHHVLHTILVKLVVDAAGLSPLTLRLPALLGGLLYLIFCALICRGLFSRSSSVLLVFGALALNPFLLDFLVAARGYGLALGLFAWQIYELIRALESAKPELGRAFRASVAGGLTVAANLTFAFAVLSAALVFLWLSARKESESGRRMWGRRFARLILVTILPGPIVGGAIVAAPLAYAKPVMFYTGFSQLEASLDSLLAPTLCHSRGMQANLLCALYRLAPHRIAFWAALALVLLVAAVTTMRWKKDAAQQFLALTLGTTAGILMLSNALLGMRYPGGRTGLYLILLATLTGAMSLVNLSEMGTTRRLRLAALPLWILVATFLLQFNLRYFYTWRYDAANARLFSTAAHSSPVGRPIWICTQWVYVPSLTFYRTLNHDDGVRIDAQKRTDCDYLILDHEDRFIGFNYAEERTAVPAQEVMKETISGTTLLKSQ